MRRVSSTDIAVTEGDITRLEVDAVVNAANEHLAHGGGVAAAISRAGGPLVQEESDRWVGEHGPLGVGEAAVTSAGSLPARHVIHVVGPRYTGSPADEGDLRSAVVAALDAAVALGAKTVAMPAISAGIFGYPVHDATRVIVEAVAGWARHSEGIDTVLLVGFNDETKNGFETALEAL